MTEEAKAAQRQYYKQWRAANPDKVREKNRRYWEKRAAREKGEKSSEYQENQIQD